MFLETFAVSTLLFLASAAPTELQRSTNGIKWSNCYNQSVPLKCANLSVPVDWNNPKGQHFNLFITKIPARGPSPRIGSLFFQPGGPGSAVSEGMVPGGKYLNFWAQESKTTEVFDFIAIDPRGTGKSNPVRCNSTIWNKAGELTLFPETKEAYDQMATQWQEFGKSCLDLTGPFLKYVDTISAVKDYEAVRVALGNEPMTLLGQSYGAQFGAQYAEVFPDNIRAIALDGILDHSQINSDDVWETESKGFEDTLNQFFNWCKSNSTCALHNEKDLPAYFDRLINNANEYPISYTPEGCADDSCKQMITGSDIAGALQSFLILPNGEGPFDVSPGWAGLAQLLQIAVETNNFDVFASSALTTNTAESYSHTAIICADWNFSQENTTYAKYQNAIKIGKTMSPHTRGAGDFWTMKAVCQNWPVAPRNPPHEIITFKKSAKKLKTPILLVNAYHDPETNYAWAISMQKQLGDANSVLLSRNGSGHTSYYQSGAVTDAIDNYLIHLKVPAPGTVLRNDGI